MSPAVTPLPVKTSIAGVTTGSLVNYIYGNNQTRPEKGQGATLLLYSDRHAYLVTEVSNDGLKATLQRYDAKRTDSNGISEDQTYDLTELTGERMQIEYRKNGWYQVHHYVAFTKSFAAWIEANEHQFNSDEALQAELWGDTPGSLQLVAEKTRAARKLSKISIVFGFAREYCAPTF